MNWLDKRTSIKYMSKALLEKTCCSENVSKEQPISHLLHVKIKKYDIKQTKNDAYH